MTNANLNKNEANNYEQFIIWLQSRQIHKNSYDRQTILMQPCFGLGCIIEGQRMSFTVGGHRFDAMVSPEGQEHWAIQQYEYDNSFGYFDRIRTFYSYSVRKFNRLFFSSQNTFYQFTNGRKIIIIILLSFR